MYCESCDTVNIQYNIPTFNVIISSTLSNIDALHTHCVVILYYIIIMLIKNKRVNKYYTECMLQTSASCLFLMKKD